MTSGSTKELVNAPLTALTIPIRDEVPSILEMCAGFRIGVLELGDKGEVLSGAGCGTDFIILKWGERTAVLRHGELLRAWVATFDPEAAARFPKTLKETP